VGGVYCAHLPSSPAFVGWSCARPGLCRELGTSLLLIKDLDQKNSDIVERFSGVEVSWALAISHSVRPTRVRFPAESTFKTVFFSLLLFIFCRFVNTAALARLDGP